MGGTRDVFTDFHESEWICSCRPMKPKMKTLTNMQLEGYVITGHSPVAGYFPNAIGRLAQNITPSNSLNPRPAKMILLL